MQRLTPILAAALALGALDAHAHTRLAGSSPAAGTTVHAPVTEIVLEFAEAVRLTALTLTDAAGLRVALAAAPTDVAARFVVGVRADLEPGEYTIGWRCVGADTHIVSGEIPFTLAGSPQN